MKPIEIQKQNQIMFFFLSTATYRYYLKLNTLVGAFKLATHKHKDGVRVRETYLLILEFLAGDSAPLRSWRKY